MRTRTWSYCTAQIVLFVLLVLTVAVNGATLVFGVLAVALIRTGALVLRPTESRRG